MQISDIEKIKENNGEYISTNKKGQIIELRDVGNVYYQQVTEANGAYRAFYYYDKNSLNIKEGWTKFFDIKLGYEEYNDNGNIIKQIDYQKAHRFTIPELIDLLKNEFDIDLMVPKKNLSVKLHTMDEQAYVIKDPCIGGGSFRFIKIHSETGAKILDTIGYYVE